MNCRACNRRCDAWLCDRCSFVNDFYDARFKDDHLSATASSCARAAQRRLGRTIGHEQWMAIVSIIDLDVTMVDERHTRADHEHFLRASKRNRKLLHDGGIWGWLKEIDRAAEGFLGPCTSQMSARVRRVERRRRAIESLARARGIRYEPDLSVVT